MGVSNDFPRSLIALDGENYFVAVADTPNLQRQGLMNVTDLDPLDGMLFVYRSESTVAHWMKDTLIPLDIAFFDNDGDLVSWTSMVPCEEADDADCPRYSSAGPARYSLEVAAGGFANLSPSARMVLLGDATGNGKEI